MRRQAGVQFVPQYLTNRTERSSSGFSSAIHFGSARTAALAYDPQLAYEQQIDLDRRPIAVIRSRSAVGGIRKRAFDVVAACAGLLLLFPLLLLIALMVKLADRGPIIYMQRRIGRNGRSFYCLKFRTMVPYADTVLGQHLAADRQAAAEWRACRKLKDDPRVTPLGLVLRKTSLDELPQLLNILVGDMSVVGPRPVVSAELANYGASVEHYLSARPGLTGLWQVNGRSDIDYVSRVALDRRYVEEWSFGQDLTIILKTVIVVLSSRGCY